MRSLTEMDAESVLVESKRIAVYIESRLYQDKQKHTYDQRQIQDLKFKGWVSSQILNFKS